MFSGAEISLDGHHSDSDVSFVITSRTATPAPSPPAPLWFRGGPAAGAPLLPHQGNPLVLSAGGSFADHDGIMLIHYHDLPLEHAAGGLYML